MAAQTKGKSVYIIWISEIIPQRDQNIISGITFYYFKKEFYKKRQQRKQKRLN